MSNNNKRIDGDDIMISLPSSFNTDLDDPIINNHTYSYHKNLVHMDERKQDDDDSMKDKTKQRPNLSLVTPSRVPIAPSDLSPLSPFQTPAQLLNAMHNTTNKALHSNNRQPPLSAGLLDDELSLRSPNSATEHQLCAKPDDYDQSDAYHINDIHNNSTNDHEVSDDHPPKFTYMRRSSHSTTNTSLNVPRSMSTISRSSMKAPISRSNLSRTSSKNQFSPSATIDHTIELNKVRNELQLVKDELNAKDILLQSKVEQVTELTSQLLEYQQNYNNQFIDCSDDEHSSSSSNNNRNTQQQQQINKYGTLSVDQRTDYQNELKQLDDHAVAELFQRMRDDMIDYTQKYHSAVVQRKLLHKQKQRYYIELSTAELDTDLKRHTVSPSKRTSQFSTSLLHQKCNLQNLRSQYRTLQQHIRQLNRSIPQLENRLDQLHSVSSSNDKQHELLDSMHLVDTQKHQLNVHQNELIQIESQINECDTAIAAQQQCINHSMDTRYNDYTMTQTEYQDVLQSYDEQQQLIEVTLEGLNETSYRLPYVQIEYLTRQYNHSQSQIQQLNNTVEQLLQQNKVLSDTVNQSQNHSVSMNSFPLTSNNNTLNINSALDKKSIRSPTSLRQRSTSSLKVDTSVRNVPYNVIPRNTNTNPLIVQPLNIDSVHQLSIQRSTSTSSSTSLLSQPYISNDIATPLSPFTPHSVDPTNTPDIRYKEKMEQVEARIKSEMNKLMIKRQQLMSKLSPGSSTQASDNYNHNIQNTTNITNTTERRARIKRPSQSQPACTDPLYNTTMIMSNDNHNIISGPVSNTAVTNLHNITDLSRRLASTSTQSSQPPSRPLTPSRKVGFGSPEPENQF